MECKKVQIKKKIKSIELKLIKNILQNFVIKLFLCCIKMLKSAQPYNYGHADFQQDCPHSNLYFDNYRNQKILHELL